MAHPLTARCDLCVYGVPVEGDVNLTGEKLMECRIDPPAAYPIQQHGGGVRLGSAFRPTKAEWWCGKFKGAVNG